MFDEFTNLLKELESEAGLVVATVSDDGMKPNIPVVMHPRVWKTKDEAVKASGDLGYRTKMEVLKKLEDKMRIS